MTLLPWDPNRRQFLGIIGGATAAPALLGQSVHPPGALLCEYRENPLGIDATAPRLCWQMKPEGRGAKQTAYRVLVASSEDSLKRGMGDLWDSGKVESDQSLHVRYAGKPLAPRQQCYWQVRTWGGDGAASPWSLVATWEMGLPSMNDWKDATWIRIAKDTRHSPLTRRPVQTQNMKEPRMAEAYSSPLFRREFAVNPRVVRARAYVCGIGYNEVYVNGQRCGNAVLDPGRPLTMYARFM